MTEDTALLRRFLRTVRVAAHTALAEYEIGQATRAASAPIRFQALAAKGVGEFRFPESGIVSADGLVIATVARGADGRAATLVLQAQGSAGLDVYAGRSVRLGFGPLAPEIDTAFDADGRAVADLTHAEIEEDDLASFAFSPAEGQ